MIVLKAPLVESLEVKLALSALFLIEDSAIDTMSELLEKPLPMECGIIVNLGT